MEGKQLLIGESLARLLPNTSFTPLIFVLDAVHFSTFFTVTAFSSTAAACYGTERFRIEKNI
jgi:hypothetical protein